MAVFIALGANQDSVFKGAVSPPIETFSKALDNLTAFGVQIQAASHIWQSPAWPDPAAQPAYLNAVVSIKTQKPPEKLLAVLKQVEANFGRMPSKRNAPRPLDLDILDYDGCLHSSERLTLPHPRMFERSFVLFPLQDIAPNWRDPLQGRSVQDWLARIAYKDVKPLKRLAALRINQDG